MFSFLTPCHAFSQSRDSEVFKEERQKLLEMWCGTMEADCGKANDFLDKYVALIENPQTEDEKSINLARERISIVVIDECNLSCNSEGFQFGSELAYDVKDKICGAGMITAAIIPGRCGATLKSDCLAQVDLVISTYCSKALSTTEYFEAKEKCDALEVRVEGKL